MSDTDILDRLSDRKTWLELEGLDPSAADVQSAIEEIDRLRADLIAEQGYRAAAEEIATRRGEMVDALNAERDEARRELCIEHLSPEAEARRRGWDCFKEGK
jgi:hypothetical protein